MKKFFVILMVVVMSLALVACGGEKQTDEPSTVIKIGGTGPLTGGAAIYGNAAANGAKIAVDEINALGGLQFELRYEDDAHDAEKAANAYNQLKDWGAQVTLGSVTSAPAQATSAMNYADGIFAITPSASSTAVTEGKNNVFQMCFTDPGQGTKSAEYISEKGLATKVAVIYKNDDVYSTGIYETFVAEAANRNMEVVSVTTFTTETQNDFSVQIADAKNNGADLVFLPMYYDAASLILAQAAAVGYEPTFFGVDGMDGILAMPGFDTSLAEGVILLTSFSADAEDAKSFVDKYVAAHSETPNQFAAGAYDAVYALYQACTAAGVTPDMTAQQINDLMIAQFTTMSFDGLTGTDITWDATGAVSKAPRGMVIENGAYVGMD